MAAVSDIPEIPEDQHPALLLVRAHELVDEADALQEQAKAKRAEAARLRARAERLRDGEHLRPKKPEPMDPLLAAASLAVEDLDGYWTPSDLAEALELTDKARAVRLVFALRDLGVVVKVEDKWRTVDPDEARVRDTLRELGTCSQQELAEKLQMAPVTLDYYLDYGVAREWCHIAEDGHLMYVKGGPERIITSRPRRPLPEKDRPAYDLAPHRGEAIRVVNHGSRGTRQGQANRHRIKQRDARYNKMQEARAERSQKDKAKAGGGEPVAASSGYSGKRNPRRKTKKKQGKK
jgi:hypothetical protein